MVDHQRVYRGKESRRSVSDGSFFHPKDTRYYTLLQYPFSFIRSTFILVSVLG